MMLDKKEIMKLVLCEITTDQYKNLKKSIDKKSGISQDEIPSYEQIQEAKGRYALTNGLIDLDKTIDGEKEDWKDLLKQVKETGYDLRLGKQYVLSEKLEELDSNKNSILRIPPHDVVVVLTYEYLRVPKGVVGTFQLRLTYVLKGLMLVNGAHLGPAYEGRLACVLFNLTKKPILIKYKDKFANISFIKLCHSSEYQGEHQKMETIPQFMIDYPTSGLADINAKLDEYHTDLEKYKKDIEDKIRNTIIIILAILSAILTIYNIFIKK